MTDYRDDDTETITWRLPTDDQAAWAKAEAERLAAEFDDDQVTWIINELEMLVHRRREAAAAGQSTEPA